MAKDTVFEKLATTNRSGRAQLQVARAYIFVLEKLELSEWQAIDVAAEVGNRQRQALRT